MFLNVDFMRPFKENGYILYTLFIHMQAYLGGKNIWMGFLRENTTTLSGYSLSIDGYYS